MHAHRGLEQCGPEWYIKEFCLANETIALCFDAKVGFSLSVKYVTGLGRSFEMDYLSPTARCCEAAVAFFASCRAHPAQLVRSLLQLPLRRTRAAQRFSPEDDTLPPLCRLTLP